MMTPQHPDLSFLQVFNESGYSVPCNESDLKPLVELISKKEQASFDLLEVVYVHEQEIVRINKEFLDRDYVTDIISFRYDEDESNKRIEGTLYCCAQRIAEQAKEFDESEESEFKRIFIHGTLHLIGYDDQTPKDKKRMTELENFYLGNSM